MPTISGWSTGETVASADINTFLLRGNRNAIINGDFRVNQRQATSIADDAYCLDRWNILSDGATITVAQSTVAPSDGKYSLAMQSGTNAKKFGVAQYIENLNCVGMFGQTVTLSFKAKVSNATNLPNIKAGILSWSSTADTLTSDFVSSWGASGTTPTLITNWTFENTPSNLGVTTSWATYRVQGVIDTLNAANVAVFIWSDSTANTTSDVLYVTDVQCEIGTIATPFERISMAEQLVNCQRYCQRFDGAALYSRFGAGTAESATLANILVPCIVTPRTGNPANQTLTYSAIGTTGNRLYLSDGTAITNMTVLALSNVGSTRNFGVTATTAGGLTTFRTYYLEESSTGDEYIIFAMEL